MDKTNNLDIFMTDLADSIREATGETGSINAQSFSTRITGLGTGKQDKLVSGENIKTINGESIVGSGDLTIEGGAKIYTWSPTITSIEDAPISGTFTEEEYYNILNADVLYIKVDGQSIFCIARGINSENGEGIRITGSQITTYADFAIDIFLIKGDGVFTGTISEPIPSKTSQLENDSNFISSDGLKTINGKSIVGSGDITISGGSSSGDGIVTKIEAIAPKNGVLIFAGNELYPAIKANTIYVQETVSAASPLSVVGISAFEETTDVYVEYVLIFQTAQGAPQIILPDYVKWANGSIPTIETYTTYELNIARSMLAGEATYCAVLTPFKLVE